MRSILRQHLISMACILLWSSASNSLQSNCMTPRDRPTFPRETAWGCFARGCFPVGNHTPANKYWPTQSSSISAIADYINVSFSCKQLLFACPLFVTARVRYIIASPETATVVTQPPCISAIVGCFKVSLNSDVIVSFSCKLLLFACPLFVTARVGYHYSQSQL